MKLGQLVELAQRFLPLPGPNDDKYSRGVTGFVTGGEDFPGAALLGIAAALACPVGMVRYVGPLRTADLILLEHPEVVVTQRASEAGRCQTWVVGSGVSPHDKPQVQNLTHVLQLQPTAVVDAGALEVLDFERQSDSNLILTPHHGEAARLLERVTGMSVAAPATIQDAVSLATRLQAAVGHAVLLKGSTTVLVDATQGPLLVGPNSPHLATAGSGDVLAGLLGGIGACVKGKVNWLEVAEFAVSLHSFAAEQLAKRQTVTASAIAKELPSLVRQLQETP